LKKELDPKVIALVVVGAIVILGGLSFFTAGSGVPETEKINPAGYENDLKGRGGPGGPEASGPTGSEAPAPAPASPGAGTAPQGQPERMDPGGMR